MSTRATYQLGDRVLYCHHDGYREGAAWRFGNMIAALTAPNETSPIEATETRRGGIEFAFIRGNLDAMPAWDNSHDGHGDTEWAYTIEESDEHGLTVRVGRRHTFNGPMEFMPAAPLAAFVNTFGARFNVPTIVAARPSAFWRRPVLATIENARRIAERERELAARFNDGNPNKASHLAAAEAWEAAIAEAA